MTAQGSERCEHDTEYSWVLVKEGHNGSVHKKYYEKCPYCQQPEVPKAQADEQVTIPKAEYRRLLDFFYMNCKSGEKL